MGKFADYWQYNYIEKSFDRIVEQYKLWCQMSEFLLMLRKLFRKVFDMDYYYILFGQFIYFYSILGR